MSTCFHVFEMDIRNSKFVMRLPIFAFVIGDVIVKDDLLTLCSKFRQTNCFFFPTHCPLAKQVIRLKI